MDDNLVTGDAKMALTRGHGEQERGLGSGGGRGPDRQNDVETEVVLQAGYKGVGRGE